MGYQVLARKLRPADFDALVGQDHVVNALKHGLDNDRLHHAYLFTGTRGVGKTTIARILAKSLNCEQGVSSKPCGTCSVCVEVAENRFIDLIEVDAASRTGVDDTRELLENAQYSPARGRYKVYLIDEVHMLSKQSFNALLKTLEEPPDHVKFLLATTDPKKVPVTVLSRCLQFQLKNISAAEMSEYLQKVLEAESISFEIAALDTLTRAAKGSMRDALSLTDQVIGHGRGQISQTAVSEMLGTVGRDELGAVVDALVAGQAEGILSITQELAQRSVDFEDVGAALIAYFHELAVADAIGESSSPFSPDEIQLYYQIAVMGYRDLHIVPDPRLGVEMTLLRMLTFAPEGARSEVAPRTNKITEVVGSNIPDTKPTKSTEPAADPAPSAKKNTKKSRAIINEQDGSLQSQWYQWVSAMSVGGVAQMILEHSELVLNESGTKGLVLDRAHDTLLNDGLVASISRAFTKMLGEPTEVTVTIGDISIETPFVRNVRIRAERQAQAEVKMKSDPDVQELLSEFGGEIEEIKPVDAKQ